MRSRTPASSLRTATKASRPEAEGFGIDLGGVSAERAPGFELADALQHRGRGQPDGPGNLDLGLARVGLQEVEDLEVGVVECSVVHAQFSYYALNLLPYAIPMILLDSVSDHS